MPTEPITIAIIAMGGEGGGVLADWIVDVAEHSGFSAQMTSVPGVAQRTGSTIYYIELFPETSKQPVLAFMPFPGELDVVIASELMEAGRAVQRGLVTRDRTTFIASGHRVYSMEERTAMADERVDTEKLFTAAREAAKYFITADFGRIAEENRSVISAALFGALAASAALPFPRDQFEAAIRRSEIAVDRSLRTFAAGFAAARQPTPSPTRHEISATDEIIQLARERLTDFQDARYAAEYLARVGPVSALDPQNGPLLSETARYLALWMTYEDAIRVADQKIRRTRFDRVASEARVEPNQILEIHEYLHPGLEEITDILPTGIARLLRAHPRLIEKFTSKGRIVHTTSITGFLQLYFLASLRPLRRKSSRFHREQQQIDAWLSQITAIAPANYALAVEIAQCPRVLKGYGDTHRLGLRNFDALMAAIPQLRPLPDAAARLKKLREAALADDTGKALTKTLEELAA